MGFYSNNLFFYHLLPSLVLMVVYGFSVLDLFEISKDGILKVTDYKTSNASSLAKATTSSMVSMEIEQP